MLACQGWFYALPPVLASVLAPRCDPSIVGSSGRSRVVCTVIQRRKASIILSNWGKRIDQLLAGASLRSERSACLRPQKACFLDIYHFSSQEAQKKKTSRSLHGLWAVAAMWACNWDQTPANRGPSQGQTRDLRRGFPIMTTPLLSRGSCRLSQ
jgi:hypothetical protein